MLNCVLNTIFRREATSANCFFCPSVRYNSCLVRRLSFLEALAECRSNSVTDNFPISLTAAFGVIWDFSFLAFSTFPSSRRVGWQSFIFYLFCSLSSFYSPLFCNTRLHTWNSDAETYEPSLAVGAG